MALLMATLAPPAFFWATVAAPAKVRFFTARPVRSFEGRNLLVGRFDLNQQSKMKVQMKEGKLL